MAITETQIAAYGSAAFKVKLEGNGISVDRSVDAPTAWRIMAVLMEADGTAAAGPGMPAAAAQQAQTPAASALQPVSGGQPDDHGQSVLSLREYLDAHKPGRNVEKIVAIAMYLKTHRGMETFTKEAVRKGFQQASEPAPGNYGRDFNWARSTGWIANVDKKRGEYYVTETGRKAVDANFPAEIKKTSGVAKTARKRRPKAKTEGAD